MLKASDLDAVRAELQSGGADVGPIEQGAHERRFTVVVPGGWAVMIYAAL